MNHSTDALPTPTPSSPRTSQLATPLQPLTFGIELEFVISTHSPPFHAQDFSTIHYPSSVLRTHIKNNLSHLPGITADTQEDIFPPAARYTWIIEAEANLLSPPAENGETWYGVEIKSPVLTFCPEALSLIVQVCQALTATYKVEVNRSCGLHVHIGQGFSDFDAETVRRLLAIVWSLEPTLDKLHPKHRRENLGFCPSLREFSQLSNLIRQSSLDITPTRLAKRGLEVLLLPMKRKLEEEAWDELDDFPPSPASSLSWEIVDEDPGFKILESEHDLEDLSFLSGPLPPVGADGGCRSRVHVGNLVRSHDKKTVEFREHEGTLDSTRVANWVKVCGGIVELARKSGKELEEELLEWIDSDVEVGVEKMLELLDLNGDVIVYCSSLMKQFIAEEVDRNQLIKFSR
ncbi:putative amidoligase enzyme-domain-containing protein [Halenospora varia]|nr:putative amidoligase enzyme-domain-containing protein [Halenospora varia]